MAIPAVSWIQFFSQALPIAATARVRDRAAAVPYRRLALWCTALVLADVVDQVSAVTRGHNLDTAYVALPIEVGLTLWTMAAWQPSELSRLAYVIAIPIMMAAAIAVVLLTDPTVTFVQWVSPFLALLALVSVLHTLVARALMSRSHLTSQGWFWVCMGMGVFWTGFITVPMFANIFLETHRSWVVAAYIARAWVNIGAFLLITWGVLCPLIQARSSGSS